MTRADVSFISISDDAETPFAIATQRNGVLAHDGTQSPQDIDGARAMFEGQMRESLARGRGYPSIAGDKMLDTLNWNAGYHLLQERAPEVIKFAMSQETWHLLPEMTPVRDDPDRWFDTLSASFRTLGVVNLPPVPRVEESSLAILYEKLDDGEEMFHGLARQVQRELAYSKLRTTLYNGGKLPAERSSRFEILSEIFHQYRAVLFLGHLRRPADTSGWGWELAPGRVVPMEELRSFLGQIQTKGHRRSPTPVPEVLFAGCCAAAWKDATGLVYPQLFLEAGIRFFIGGWMDIELAPAKKQDELEVVGHLTAGFFKRWTADPDGAVHHLFEAKRACDFHLVTGLYHLYTTDAGHRQATDRGADTPPARPPRDAEAQTDDDPVDVAEARASEPRAETTVPPASMAEAGAPGALLASISAGATLGDYHLDQLLWIDRYAHMFHARHRDHGSTHLVQVPVDEWQLRRDLPQRIDRAIERLRAVSSATGHLVPDRRERVRVPGKVDLRSLLVLVYDLAPEPGDAAEPGDHPLQRWQRLCDRKRPDGEAREVWARRLGIEIALALSGLHAAGLIHGNIDPSNVLVTRRGGDEQVALKDAWVHLCELGRSSSRPYAAPEEPARSDDAEASKIDIFSFGVLLCWLATGTLTPAADPDAASVPLPARADALPQVLRRLIARCLMAVTAFRPPAAAIAHALRSGRLPERDAIDDLAPTFLASMAAGQRLFALAADDFDELTPLLDGFENAGHAVFVAAEGDGLVDRHRRHGSIVPWIDKTQLETELTLQARADGTDDRPRLTDDEVGAINFTEILDHSMAQARLPGQRSGRPVIVVRGFTWWSHGSVDDRLGIRRALRRCQGDPDAPAILVTDSFISLEQDLDRHFAFHQIPPLTLYELYQRIRAFPADSGTAVPEVDRNTATELAFQIYPCSARGLTDALRLAAFRHGVIDHRAGDFHDLQRETALGGHRALRFVPLARLPAADALGLHPALEERVTRWCSAVLAARGGSGVAAVPQRLVIEGPSGYGRSELALVLARRTGRAVVQLQLAHSLRDQLGQSEAFLRQALATATSPHGTVVVLDDLDHFLGLADLADENRLEATLQRMSTVLLRWFDEFAHGDPLSTVIATCRRLDALPEPWRWRFELRLRLDRPAGLTGGGADTIVYRRAVFAAVLRRFGLAAPAADTALLDALAERSHPRHAERPVPSPIAHVSDQPELARHTAVLDNGAAIHQWVADTVRLNADRSDPHQSAFWLDRLT